MIYLLTAIGLTPGGSSTVHIYTQTIHRTTQNKQYIEQHNNLGECGPCSVLASYTLAFALQLRKCDGIDRYISIYLLTAIGLSPGGSSTVHIYTQTVHRTTQNKQYMEQKNYVTNKICHILSARVTPYTRPTQNLPVREVE